MTLSAVFAILGLVAQAWLQQFPVDTRELSTAGENAYFILKPGYQLTYQESRAGKAGTLVITVLNETRNVGGIETRVVEERETSGGELIEVSRNYFAIHTKSGDVYYFGEDVDMYKKGKVVSHEGSWQHGSRGAHFGLMMPGAPAKGMRFYQELAKGIAMDRAEIVSLTDRLTTPAGEFAECLKTKETTPLEPLTREYKIYARGVGLVKDGDLELVSHQFVPAGRAVATDVIHVPLEYRAPGAGPKPNFSPKGTPVPLTPVAADMPLPAGASRPASAGTIKIGADRTSWIPVLATADPEHPHDFSRLFLDRNRNGSFADEGPPIAATPSQNEKTKAWWTSFNTVELSLPYAGLGDAERYLVNFWIVRDGDNPADVVRYSVGSWRYGTADIGGVRALVAAMDADNDGVFSKGDNWSVLEASAPDAEKTVLSYTEARPTSRLMFVKADGHEQVLEFRSFSPDGRSVDFAVVDRPVTKTADRAGDDTVAAERGRARTTTPFSWSHDFNAGLAQAKAQGKKLFIDFEATWCGPCKTMDEWIWTDAEVAARLNAGFVGVKLDGDIEKALVKRFTVQGYPTMIVLDATGGEANRGVGYLSSKDVLAMLGAR